MKKFVLTLMLTLLLLAGLAPAARAQANPLALHLEQVDVTAFPTVTLRLNSWEFSGLPLAKLSPADLSLSEDDGAAFHPDAIQPDQNAPLGVALVLDVSGSMAGKPLNDAKAAAARFLDRLKHGDKAALLAFSSPVNPDPAALDPTRELAFTSVLAPVYDLAQSLEARGNTELYNAAYKAVRMTASLPAGHRAVLLLTDGRNEPADVGSPDEAILAAKEANIPFFVIGLGDQLDEVYLRRLASETGGLYRAAPSSSELAALFSDTATLLKTQYLVSYQSRVVPDGKSHNLTVNLNVPQGQATSRIGFGPLPAAPVPTDTAQPVPTATSTKVPPTPAPTVAPKAIAMPAVPPFYTQPAFWAWPLAALIALVLSISFTLRRRKPAPPKPVPEKCAKCGYDLTGQTGACPMCGETRRLPK